VKASEVSKKTAFLIVEDSLQLAAGNLQFESVASVSLARFDCRRKIARTSFTGYSDPFEERTPVMRSSRATAWFSARPNDLNAASRMWCSFSP